MAGTAAESSRLSTRDPTESGVLFFVWLIGGLGLGCRVSGLGGIKKKAEGGREFRMSKSGWIGGSWSEWEIWIGGV